MACYGCGDKKPKVSERVTKIKSAYEAPKQSIATTFRKSVEKWMNNWKKRG